MSDTIFGMDAGMVYGLVLLLLLVILGIVSFHYYFFIKSTKGLSVGAGFGVGILNGNDSQQQNTDNTSMMMNQQ